MPAPMPSFTHEQYESYLLYFKELDLALLSQHGHPPPGPPKAGISTYSLVIMVMLVVLGSSIKGLVTKFVLLCNG